ncbi:hypothetical protein CLV62_101240 [Dysgonomonas alginatilytica]|uniref:Purine nucleoside phosphorylase n=1 Tax=Dysgonomonas alginatilytica TaxID=1605892 RepID=A0A2V3PW00_9BACT|nr:peptidoglycan editing factor PgeF [Dysgonomonas alginatilytica]PXV68974.1 hypothetical protein CLV62_101240 [Dysgonomonas alginatilytica]
MIDHKLYSNLLQFESLNSFDSLLHFSTTIDGGVSNGNYTSFNLGLYSGDNVDNVIENRRRLASMLNIFSENLIFPYQTHGDDVCIIDNEFLSKGNDEQMQLLHGIDAVITNQKNICIGIGTADCVPILIYDPENKVLAAIHAGWRGTVAKLASKVVTIMKATYNSDPAKLVAGIAPSISPDYFEVGVEVVEEFVKAGFLIDDIGYYDFNTTKFHVDLWFANELLLTQSGIPFESIEVAGMCTYAHGDQFFSARRQGIQSGRLITGGVIIS